MRILPTFIPPFEALPTRPKTLTPRLQIPETMYAWDAAPGRAHAHLVDEGDCQIVALSGTNGFLRQNSLSRTGSRQVPLDTAQFRLHGFVTGFRKHVRRNPQTGFHMCSPTRLVRFHQNFRPLGLKGVVRGIVRGL